MSKADNDPFNPPLWPGEPIDIDVDKLLRTQNLKNEYDRRGMFLSYHLQWGDSIQLEVAGLEDVEGKTARTLHGDLWDANTGLFHITKDSLAADGLTDTVVNFGTYTNNLGNVKFERPGVLRGLITPSAQMAIDTRGRHFFDESSETIISPLVYVGLSVNGVRFFNI